MLSITCPQCKVSLSVPDEAAGKAARCRGCGSTIPVPSYPSAVPVPQPSAARVAAGNGREGDDDHDHDDDYDRRPRRRPRPVTTLAQSFGGGQVWRQIIWTLCGTYVLFMMLLALLGAPSTGVLVHVVGATAIAFAIDRALTP